MSLSADQNHFFDFSAEVQLTKKQKNLLVGGGKKRKKPRVCRLNLGTRGVSTSNSFVKRLSRFHRACTGYL